jgi:hypothetical protein
MTIRTTERLCLWPVVLLLAFSLLSCSGGGSSELNNTGVDTGEGCAGSSPLWTTTPDQEAVSTCIAAAASGDTVRVLAGTAVWTKKVALNKSISLIGVGEGRTIITDGVPKDHMLVVDGGTVAISPRISGMTIKGLSTDKIGVIATVMIEGISNGLGFRLDHITFDNILITGLGTNDWVWGVIDHCTFNMKTDAVGWAIYFSNERWGDLTLCCGDMAWASPDDFGSRKFSFVEDSIFNPIGIGPTNYIDSAGGARYVLRHNSFHDGFLRAHGTDSTEQVRGTRAVEIYKNSFINNAATFDGVEELRSGPAIFYENQFSGSGGFNHGIILKAFRDNGNFWPVWRPCDGTTDWDQNLPGEQGYACLDQPGRGEGNLVTTTANGLIPAIWPNQVLSPVYFWNNLGWRNDEGGSTSTRIQLGRDFFNSPKPGYVPYTYPHPLQSQ